MHFQSERMKVKFMQILTWVLEKIGKILGLIQMNRKHECWYKQTGGQTDLQKGEITDQVQGSQ